MPMLTDDVLMTPQRLSVRTLFRGWKLTDIKNMLTHAAPVQFEAGTFMFKRGEVCTAFYLIDEGQVQMQLTSQTGQAKPITTLKALDSVGESYVLMDKPYGADALALTAVRALQIKKTYFIEYLLRRPDLMRQMLARFSERLYYIFGDVSGASLQSGTQRVIGYLLGELSLGGGNTVTLSKTKAQVAAVLNLTPEHFSRILHDLSTRQLIAVEGRRIVLLDVDGLCLYDR